MGTYVMMFEEYGKGMMAPLSDFDHGRKNWCVTVMTLDAIKKFKKKHPGEPMSMNHIGYHFAPESYKKATSRKKELEEKGKYNGEKIDYVSLSKASDKIGEF